MPQRTKIGLALEAGRLGKSLTMKEAAEAAHLRSAESVSEHERKNVVPNNGTLVAYSRAYDLDLAELLSLADLARRNHRRRRDG